MLLEDLYVVLKVAEFKSITAAATHLDMRTATASAAVKRVEASLGTELFIRTTRQLRLSPAGERYLPQCDQAMQMLEQAKFNIKEDPDIIEGELRIALSSDLGRHRVIPWLDKLMEKHPSLSLRAHISDSNIDFYRDAVDLALRYGSPNDSTMYGFKICDVPRVLCASPEYLAKHGMPENLDELQLHNGLLYQLHDITHNIWEFSSASGLNKVRMTGNRSSNDGELVKRWCLSGKGVALKSSLDMSEELLSGKAVSMLSEYQATPTELWLICPSRQSITPAVRILRDELKSECESTFLKMLERGILRDLPKAK